MDFQTPPILQCNNLVKRYGAFTALNGINLTIPRGKIIGLLGPNGSGKTTFIKLTAGLLTQNSGQLLINGQAVGAQTKATVSYLPERPYFNSWMKISEMIEYFTDFYADFDANRARAMLADLGVNINAQLKSLSKGTKEKVQLVLVMSRRASLYLLDEPIAGVDPAARDYILRTIVSNFDRNATILISTHLIQDIENVLDEFFFISNGNLLMYNSVENVHNQGKTVDSLFREVFRC